MRYLLDQNTLSHLFERDEGEHHDAVKAKFTSLGEVDEVCVSVITLSEWEYSCSNARSVHVQTVIRKRIARTKAAFSILPVREPVASIFGELKADLNASRKANRENLKKHNMDILLAGVALTENCIVVSNDSIFPELSRRKLKLQHENWARDEHCPT